MIIILGDLLLDYSLRLASMAIEPKDLHRVTYMELGPGGATNVAITARRLGLDVACLGEVGDDRMGRLLLDSLRSEGIDVAGIQQGLGGDAPPVEAGASQGALFHQHRVQAQGGALQCRGETSGPGADDRRFFLGLWKQWGRQ